MRQRIGPFLLGLSLAGAYILGCATSQVSRPAVQAQAQMMAVGVQRWQYYCTEGRNTQTIMERANAAGMDGWEMVTVNGVAGGIWCFKRPAM